jgi:hypothetical protein
MTEFRRAAHQISAYWYEPITNFCKRAASGPHIRIALTSLAMTPVGCGSSVVPLDSTGPSQGVDVPQGSLPADSNDSGRGDSVPDAANIGLSSEDAASVGAASDAASLDAASVDAASVDAASVDAASVDAASVDAASVDAAWDSANVLLPDADGALAPVYTTRMPALLVVVKGATPTPRRGGSGGSQFTDVCPDDQMVIGYQGTHDGPTSSLALVDSLQVLCGRATIIGSGPYQFVVSPVSVLPSRGGGGAQSFAAVCPGNQVVVGIHGHAGGYLDQVGLDCAPLTLSDNRGYAIATGAPTSLPSYGGVGGSAFRDMCPMGQVARGADIAADSRVVASDLQCALPAVLPCVHDLSNIGTGDFHISFSVMTTQAGLTALINQRATCDFGQFWDIRMNDGSLLVETDEGVNLSTCQTGGPRVNDGGRHSVTVARVNGAIAAFIDGAPVGTVVSTASLRQLTPLVSHSDPCDQIDGTRPFVGAVADVCLTTL